MEAGRSVAVLDQGRVGSGTTGGTTAHVTQVPDRRFREIDSKFGRDGTRTLVASSRAALDRIAAWVEADPIDCDYQRVPAYLYTMFGTLGGMILADRILGRPNPWADLYRTKRLKPLAAGPQLAKLNLGVVKHFIQDRVEIPKIHDLSEVPLEEGRVVEIGGEKVAVYRRQDGVVHTVSPVCTHAGCIVGWNAAEKTWDCPCHGGRYTPAGEVIEGPPVKRLEPVQVQVKAER